jgi:hypothetical protein
MNLCQYLDEWLIYSRSYGEAVAHAEQGVSTVNGLGFLGSLKKSSLIPTQYPTYLGARLDLVRGRVGPSQERVTNVVGCVSSLAARECAPALS